MTKTSANGAEVSPNASEPSENEPCMGDSSGNDIKDNILIKFRGRVCKKYQVSHEVFYVGVGSVCAIFILVLIVIILGAAWPRVPHSQKYPVCEKAACLRVAAQLRESMDTSTSPCTDLWQWTCGGWLAKNGHPKYQRNLSQKQQLLEQGNMPIREVIGNLNLSLHVTSVEYKLKQLYEACLDVANVNTDGDRPIRSIINELRGWYITRDWDNADFDPKSVLKQLHVKYGVNAFFKITIEADPYAPEKNLIRISPEGLGLPDRDYYYREQDDRIQNAYKELIREVVQYLGATRQEADKFGNDMFHYEKRIAEIMPPLEHLLNPIETCNVRTVFELKESQIPFDDILTAMFPDTNISDNTEVIVTSLKYLSDISRIIATTDRQTMNGYMMWTLVRQYLPYLSENYTMAMDNFQTELFGIRPTRREFCTNLVEDHMGLALDVLRDRFSPVSVESLQVANDTYLSILNAARKSLKQFESIPQLYKHLKNKLSNLRLQIGPPESVYQNTYLKNYYVNLRVIKANLFESVRHAVEFKKKTIERTLLQWSRDDAIIKYLTFSKGQKVVYSPSNNLIIIPKSLLRHPYFESDQPRPVTYGRLGVDIAAAIMSAILPYDSFWTAERKLLSAYHVTLNDSMETIGEQRKCLFNYIVNTRSGLAHGLANESALVTLKELYAVQLASEAFSTPEHIHQPGLQEYEDDALFFMTYSQTQCTASTVQFDDYESLLTFKLPRRLYLYMAWEQLAHFSQSFHCTTNKKTQCIRSF